VSRLIIALLLLLFIEGAFASNNTASYPPHNMKTQQHHHKWMMAIKYSAMRMDGLLDGSTRLSRQDIFNQGYTITPLSMNMHMLMLSAMVKLNHRIHLMMMLPYIWKSMDHITKTGINFTTRAHGIGDLKLSGTYHLFHNLSRKISLMAGVSLPTGSVNKRDDTPAGNQRLPYPMQLGSGTVDMLLGAKCQQPLSVQWQWTTQANSTIRLGKNKNKYALGNSATLSTLFFWHPTDQEWLYGGLNGAIQGRVRGADPELTPTAVPTADPNAQGGKIVNVLLGIKFSLIRQKVSLEGALPVYQHLYGPQLKTDWQIGLHWQAML